jgi:two-component system, LytTR family, sensor histidine kinase AlgZ
MHPILADKGRIGLYLLAWLPIAGMLKYVLGATGNLSWAEAVAFTLPMVVVFAFVGLSPWYLCRVLPLGHSAVPKLILNHSAAAIVAALFWIVVAKGIALGLAQWHPQFDAHISRELPMLFGIGVLLYLLAVALHYVLLSLQDTQQAESRAQEARVLAREAELKALKAQINPHFLFNSLNSISALTTVDGVRAREMCIRLSDFLRSTLSLGENESISFADELALAKTYLAVEQVRFGPRLRIHQQIDPNCNDCDVPPLVLQPLVENAIKHGIAGLVEGGAIRLEAHRDNGLLRLTIENEFDAEAPVARKHGLGLVNVRARLRARYDNRARLDTEIRGGCFSAELTLPCEERSHML